MSNLDKLKQLVGMVGKDQYEDMSPEEKKLTKALQYLKQVNDEIKKEEFVKTVQAVMKIIVEMEKRNIAAIQKLQQEHSSFMQNERGSHEMTLADMKKQVNQGFVCERMDEMKKMMNEMIVSAMKKMHGKISEVDSKMKSVKNGYTPVKGKDYFDGQHGNILTPTEVVEKVNKAENKIQESQIEGLEDKIKQLRKEIATKSNGVTRRIYQPYVDDLSASTNGSTKIFTLSRA